MLGFLDTPIAPAALPEPTRPGGFDQRLMAALLPGAAAARAKLADPDVLVVTTGQQPGLFTGPLYTVHKALSARAVAAVLERRTGRPVVPIFWVAGDDHDFAEGAVASWLAADGSLVTGELEPRPPDAPLRPLAREPVPPRVAELLDQLATALPAGTAREETIGWLRRHYRADTTLAAAFGGALAEVLDPLGVVCLDAAAAATKRVAAPLVLEAIRRTRELEPVLVARAAALAEAGIDPDVRVGDGATLGFLDGPLGRDRLVLDGTGYRTRRGGDRLAAADLERIAAETPERLSPNVLLRPVVESAILPTVGYLAGPGELRYLRLAEALYQPLGITRQAGLPRWSGVVVEPRVVRAAEKFGVSVAELASPSPELEQRVVRSLAPADFDPAFADLRGALEAAYQRIAAVARTIDPTLEKPAQAARGAALGGAAELEKRLLAAQKRRQGELLTQLDRARTAVRPGGEPQERVIGLPALAGRYGFGVLTELAAHVERWHASALEGAPATP